MRFLKLQKIQNQQGSLSDETGWSVFDLREKQPIRETNDPLADNLRDLLNQLIEKTGADGGYISYAKSGVLTTVCARQTEADITLKEKDRDRLKSGEPIVTDQAYIYPIKNKDLLAGIICIFRDADIWQPLSEDLVHAYALLAEQNLQMQYKQDHLQKYANSLVEKKKELEKVQTYNQNLLSITTHDLSSPLNAVSGYLDMVNECLTNEEDNEKLHAYYKHIQSGVDDVSNMLMQLNEVIKFKKGFLTLDTVTVDISWVVKDICELLRASARKKEINLQAVAAEKPMYVEVDIIKFKRIIYNLVSNAIKYTGNGKDIFVHISADEDKVRIHVKDEGIGISEDKLDEIFEPFVKLNTENKDVYSQGLGLYISSYFVELMDGEIEAQSISGKGSTFTVTMPRVASIMSQSA